ncbi:unnamed protein product [Dracunculus medinensis]|uniref:Uncharacterized protein n=1 Tax=Dracunculus medinensis TaxID=318479 RepID=A0A0N4U588_DRAME|nr:unnamed protein product [Dracunculus medinensis]
MNVRKRIAQQAYDCEIGESNAYICNNLSKLTFILESNPLQSLSEETKTLLRLNNRRKLNDEDIEIVINYFLKNYVEQLMYLMNLFCK